MSDSFLKEIGRSYIVSAFLPAAFFVTIGLFLYHGFIPLSLVNQITAVGSISKYYWVAVLFLILWAAFYLYSANDVTVRLFEGYFLPKIFYKKDFSKSKIEDWEKKQLPEYSKWKQKNKDLSISTAITEEEAEQLLEAALKSLAEIANVNIKKPLNPTFLMPTRLGNVLRSSEMYAFERYAIVEIAIWPRLLPVLPARITKHLEEKNNQFMFLLNSAFLSYILAVIGIVVALVIPLLPLPNNFFYIGYDFISAQGYLLVSIVQLLFGYMLYYVAVNAAEDFSMYIRASFDLYRAELLHELNWERPNTLEEEKSLWMEVSKLLIGGSRFEADFSSFTPYQK